jgi:phosphoserine phosphatase RsbU/P
MALQIEKSKLDSDLGLAREIQSMLLPKQFPHNQLLDVHAVYQPSQKVGGDLYDIFRLDDQRVGVAIADVSGKGIAASLVMAICQTNLRHLARLHTSPAEVLRQLNRIMLTETKPDMYVTIIYAVVDTARGEIIQARGGHELPVLVAHHGGASDPLQAKLLDAPGAGLGLLPEDVFDPLICDSVQRFTAGDVFTLYTDGLTEVTNEDGIEFGNRRLADTVRTLHGRTAEAINHAILDRIVLFAGRSERADDLTLVTIKHN